MGASQGICRALQPLPVFFPGLQMHGFCAWLLVSKAELGFNSNEASG